MVVTIYLTIEYSRYL